jgi:hypothetical protein
VKSDTPEYKKIVVDVGKTSRDDLTKLKAEYQDSKDHIRFVFQGEKEKLAKIEKAEFSSLGIDVKMEENSAEVVDYSKDQVTTFDNQQIKKEWEEFTEDDEQNKQTGKEYLEKTLN